MTAPRAKNSFRLPPDLVRQLDAAARVRNVSRTMGFMPKVDKGGFVMDYYTAAGTSLDESGRQIDKMLLANPEVLTFSRRLGTVLAEISAKATMAITSSD